MKIEVEHSGKKLANDSFAVLDFEGQVLRFPAIAVCIHRDAFKRIQKLQDAGFEDPWEGGVPFTGCVTSARYEGDERFVLTLDHEHLATIPTAEVNGTIAHEAYHLACRALNRMGEDEPGEEVVAHMVGFLTHVIHQAYDMLVIK